MKISHRTIIRKKNCVQKKILSSFDLHIAAFPRWRRAILLGSRSRRPSPWTEGEGERRPVNSCVCNVRCGREALTRRANTKRARWRGRRGGGGWTKNRPSVELEHERRGTRWVSGCERRIEREKEEKKERRRGMERGTKAPFQGKVWTLPPFGSLYRSPLRVPPRNHLFPPY